MTDFGDINLKNPWILAILIFIQISYSAEMSMKIVL